MCKVVNDNQIMFENGVSVKIDFDSRNLESYTFDGLRYYPLKEGLPILYIDWDLREIYVMAKVPKLFDESLTLRSVADYGG